MSNETKRIMLKPSEVRETFGIPEGTLANLRWAKRGPRFFRRPGGRGIYYLLSDIEAWITSGPVYPSESVEPSHDHP
jgi:hypothetical protein